MASSSSRFVDSVIVYGFWGDVRMDLKECLEILELENATSQKQLKAAYRNLVRVWHPDRYASDSPHRNKAEEKLRDINIAYEKLTEFLTSKNQTNKLTRLNPEPGVRPKSVVRFKTTAQRDQSTYATKAASGKSTRRPSVSSGPVGSSTSSSVGKYLVLSSLLALTALTVFIIHYLLSLDQDGYTDRAPTSSVIKILKGDSQDSGSNNDARLRKRKFSNSGYSGQSDSDSRLSGRQSKYCEIYLKGGSVIIADTWWEQGNMIMYQTQYGTLGVEKDTVDKIIDR